MTRSKFAKMWVHIYGPKTRSDKGKLRGKRVISARDFYVPGYTRVTKAEVLAMRRWQRRGKSLRQIAKRFHRSVSTVHHWLHRRGYALAN